MNNILLMNDWGINKFIKVVVAIQFAMLGSIGLDAINLQIPILRQFVGFIYLLFIPGILILRILKLHKLGTIETLSYATGLSIAMLMFTGFLMNLIYPIFGISTPISIKPLIITISIIIAILCILCYKFDTEYIESNSLDFKGILSPISLSLYLIPILTIFGTYFVNYYHNNILLLIIIVIIAFIAILIGFGKLIPNNLFPLAVFIISISLLYHNALISMYLWGWDINIEYYYSNLVIVNQLWDQTLSSNVNAMLSITTFAPIFSIFSNMNLTWVFKIIFPLIFSLVPLCLYRILQKQVNDKIAFLSIFFFMSFFSFFTEMLQLARQQIAELFLVLIMLSIIDNYRNKIGKAIILVVFLFSLGVSHYGLSYIFMASLIVTWVFLNYNMFISGKKDTNKITTTSVLLFITFVISWYLNIARSSPFNSIVRIGNHITGSIFKEFLNPDAAQGAAIIMVKSLSPLHEISKIFHIISILFITIGILTILSKQCKMKFQKEYIAFSVVYFLILVASISVPYFSSSLNTTRVYQISMIFLAPFYVIGAMMGFKIICGFISKSWIKGYAINSLKFLSIFSAILFLFNSGWIYEITKDGPTSFSLSEIDYPLYNEQEFVGAKWLNDLRNEDEIYADNFRKMLLERFEMDDVKTISTDQSDIMKKSYIYLGSINIIQNEIILVDMEGVNVNKWYDNTDYLLYKKNKVYANGGSQVYH